MIVQVAGWLAFALGPLGTWLIPRTRHGWLLCIAASTAWAAVDAVIALWPALASAVLAVALNARCWRRHVTERSTGCHDPATAGTDAAPTHPPR